MAFDRAGASPRQTELSEFVKRQLLVEQPVEIGSGRPIEEQLRGCFPARATTPVAALFKPLGRVQLLRWLCFVQLLGSPVAPALRLCCEASMARQHVAPRTSNAYRANDPRPLIIYIGISFAYRFNIFHCHIETQQGTACRDIDLVARHSKHFFIQDCKPTVR